MRVVTTLLVEDNPDDVFAFQRIYRKAEVAHDLRVVTDGRQAIDFLEDVNSGLGPLLALVFLDLKLPQHSGFEVLEWIQTRPSLTSIPVVILSGSDEPCDHDRSRELGAVDYFAKPMDLETLRTVLCNQG